MLCEFLLYNKVSQLYVHIYFLPLDPTFQPTHPPHTVAYPTHLGHHKAVRKYFCRKAAFSLIGENLLGN